MSLLLPVVKVPAASRLCGKSYSPGICLAYSRGANGQPPPFTPVPNPHWNLQKCPGLIEFSLAARYAADVSGMPERYGRMSHDPAMTVQAWGRRCEDFLSFFSFFFHLILFYFVCIIEWYGQMMFLETTSAYWLLTDHSCGQVEWVFVWFALVFFRWKQKLSVRFSFGPSRSSTNKTRFIFYVFFHMNGTAFANIVNCSQQYKCNLIALIHLWLSFQMFRFVLQTISPSQYICLIEKGCPLLWAKGRMGEFAIYDRMVKVRHKYQIPASPASDCGIFPWILCINVSGMCKRFEEPLLRE